MTYPDGSEYVGPWKGGMRECNEGGVFIIVRIDWCKKNGRLGRLTLKSGDYYEGGWERDTKNGKGIMQVGRLCSLFIFPPTFILLRWRCNTNSVFS